MMPVQIESRDVYIDALHKGIIGLVDRFRQNPFEFLSEADLQGTLYALLVKELETTLSR